MPNQVTDFAPWQISRAKLYFAEVQGAVKALKGKVPLPPMPRSPQAQPELFQQKPARIQKDVV
jgi:hypothetical protein